MIRTPTTNPRLIPTKRSVKTIPKTVTAKGVNYFHPSRYMLKNKLGFANLYPTIRRMDAKTDSGILFRSAWIKRTEISNKNP